MLNVTVIAVGGLKEDYFAAACAEYQKRLNRFCRLNIIELREQEPGQKPSAVDVDKCLQQEGAAILEKLPPKAYTIALCIEGKTLDSPGLAKKISGLCSEYSQLAFILGGSHGLSDEVKNRAQLKLSMSPMTFPHRLARVMLLEQLYRAFSITANMKYHK